MKKIVPVTSKEQRKKFIDFPHDLYDGDPNYVPELFMAQDDLLNPAKHPFYEHSQVQLYLAYNGDTIVGRIAAILNGNHNSFNKTTDGFFGFFDVINDHEITSMLFAEAEKWLRAKGSTTIIGPVNFSTNETCGLLTEGFNSPPVAMMTYNKPYYQTLLENQGFAKKTDLLAYTFGDTGYNDKVVGLQEVLSKRLQNRGITIRPGDMKNFKDEVKKLNAVYNQAWDKNLGFVPMTENEFAFMAKDMKQVLDPEFCLVAEHEGKAIGFALAIPDINEVLIKVKRGRLFPFGIFKLLFGLGKVKGIRIITLGVTEPYRKLGIEACFYASIIKRYREKKYKRAEASWILEDNMPMNKAILQINGDPYKRYRIFEKSL